MADYSRSSMTRSFAAHGKYYFSLFKTCFFLFADVTPPVIMNCRENDPVVVSVPIGTSQTVVNFVAPTATDNSGQATLIDQTGGTPGSLFPLGENEITYTFSDASGNSAVCTFLVIVAGMLTSFFVRA